MADAPAGNSCRNASSHRSRYWRFSFRSHCGGGRRLPTRDHSAGAGVAGPPAIRRIQTTPPAPCNCSTSVAGGHAARIKTYHHRKIRLRFQALSGVFREHHDQVRPAIQCLRHIGRFAESRQTVFGSRASWRKRPDEGHYRNQSAACRLSPAPIFSPSPRNLPPRNCTKCSSDRLPCTTTHADCLSR